MFWADKIAEKIALQYKDKIADGKKLIIRDEKTMSGRVHIGSMRGVAIHGIVSEALKERGIENEFFFEINDFDAMDGIPVYLDRETYEPYMGVSLCDIPSPDLTTGQAGGTAKNFAEYFAEEFLGVIKEAGFAPTYYRSSEKYRSGAYNDMIKTALDRAELIRTIYKETSGSVKGEDWWPLNVRCEKCGKISTTRVLSWDGSEVEYECRDIEWAKGCGIRGRISPLNGNAKLPWKVEWAAKFSVIDVDIEGGGKDHSTRGGSRDVANHISREVFGRKPPFDIPYEFFLIGGKKMSSSKGQGSSAREFADLLPPQLLRYSLLYKDINQQINVDPEGDAIPLLFDGYDRAAGAFWSGKDDDVARLFKLVNQTDPKLLEKRALPRFSTVAYLVQMPHIDIVAEFEKLEGLSYGERDREELEERAKYARIWLDTYAPEDFKFEIKETLPAEAKNFTPEQKAALKKVLEYVKSQAALDGQELHTELHEIRKASGLEAAQFFGALYLCILGKQSGPKAGWFLSVLDRNFLETRLEEAAS
ncbi:MAG TPA: lysine--tRNA ligase [Candidatus Paceibacterota bacterium]|nr:lysine--tRNA ligase [Candidatus Paceibacterota bacterium]